MTILRIAWGLLLRIDLWLLVAPIVYLTWLAMRKRRSLPRPIPGPSRTARACETIALGGMSVSLLTMLLMYRAYLGSAYALSEAAPAGARIEFWALLALWSAVIAGSLLLASLRSTLLACIALIVFFSGAGYAVNSGGVLSYKRHVEAIRATPIPIDIHLAGEVEGADVWLNGVYVGKTPIHADMDELLAQVPDLEQAPNEWRDFDKMYRHGKNRLLRPLARFPLLPPTRVTSDDERVEHRYIYARVELNGQRMYSEGSHSAIQGSRLFGQIRPCYVLLEMVLPRWEEHVDLLVQQARLNDYQVDAEWIETAESYADRVWKAIGYELEREPEFGQVLDAWASHRYELDGVDDHASAFAVLQRIAAEADARSGYHTNSVAGRAVELVLPRVDPESLVGLALDRIGAYRFPPIWGSTTSYRTNSGRFHFGTYPPRQWHSRDSTAGDFVWAQAIYQLDVLLDRGDESRDNLVEQKVTPALLRLSPQRGGQTFRLAEGLGGSWYDRVACPARRRTPHWSLRDEDTVYVSNVEVNQELYRAAGMESTAGRQFRKDYARDILEMTEKIVRDGFDFQNIWSPNTIDYLFVEVGETADNLAVHFWPRFDQYATRERHCWDGAAEMRWHYLARMQPHCTPEMFADVYRRYCDYRVIQGSDSAALPLLEPDLRFNVAEALVEEAKERLAEAKPGTNNYGIRQANLDDFTRLALQVPCEASARRLVEWLEEESPDHKRRIERVTLRRDRDELSICHLRALAKAENSDLRQLVLSAIRARPTSDRRAVLRTLLKDQDDGVRSDAEGLRAELDALRRQPVPRRSVD